MAVSACMPRLCFRTVLCIKNMACHGPMSRLSSQLTLIYLIFLAFLIQKYKHKIKMKTANRQQRGHPDQDSDGPSAQTGERKDKLRERDDRLCGVGVRLLQRDFRWRRWGSSCYLGGLGVGSGPGPEAWRCRGVYREGRSNRAGERGGGVRGVLREFSGGFEGGGKRQRGEIWLIQFRVLLFGLKYGGRRARGMGGGGRYLWLV